MTIEIHLEPPPLRQDSSGAIRIGKTRLLLDMIVHAFQDGATPEAIVQRFPSVELKDVYAVIAYYLRHQEEIDRYLSTREEQAGQVRAAIDARQGDLAEIRNRLKARRSA